MRERDRCDNCRRDLKAWLYRLESWAFWLPCLIFQSRFFESCGNDESFLGRVSTRCVQGYYGAGRAWPCDNERKFCCKGG